MSAKQQGPASQCRDGVQWVWRHLAECISGPAQVAGYCLVATGMLLAVFGCCSKVNYSCSNLHVHVRVLIISLLVSTVSLIGALLSMQMVMVIAFDMVAVIVDACLVLVALGVCINHRFRGPKTAHYTLLSDGEVLGERKQLVTSRVFCFAAFSLVTLSLLLCLAKTSGTGNTSSKALIRDLTRDSHTREFDAIHQLLTMVGYAMGGAACFAVWALQPSTHPDTETATTGSPSLYSQVHPDYKYSHCRQPRHATISTNSTQAASETINTAMVLSDVFYVVGVLLQSGGWMVVMVTLPWTMKSSLRFERSLNRYEDDYDVFDTVESGSDTSNILWDQAWKPWCLRDHFPYYEKTRPKVFDTAMLRLMDEEMSTNSEWTSSSDEQELEWENAAVAPYNSSARKAARARLEQEPEHFPLTASSIEECQSRLLPLTLAIPESSDQRVLTWMSNSPPEEEKPPHLTLTQTLNLDSASPSDESILGETKFPSSHKMSSRKFSW